MEHDGCVGCKYENESPDSKYCFGCTQNAIDKYTPMTNADKIRNMSDEELAEFFDSRLSEVFESCPCETCNYGLNCCDACYLTWLQSEVREGE